MKIQKVKGTKDLYGQELANWQYVEEILHYVSNLYNFSEMRTPLFERTELFKRENDSSDVVNKEMYTFEDQGGRSLTLRPEITAGIVRSVIENKLYANVDLPLKYYYLGSNFRSERPQKGRYRIFDQFGIEVIGGKTAYLDAEAVALAYTALTALGLKQFKVVINTLGDSESRSAYEVLLKEHFKPVLSELCEDCQRRYQQNPLRILDCKVDKDHPAVKNAPTIETTLSQESEIYFQNFQAVLKLLGIPFEINRSLVRGLDYYTEVVFEILSTNPKMGSQNAIVGGGRYDHLVSELGGPDLASFGFALGIDRLVLALLEEEVSLGEIAPVDLYFMPLKEAYQKEALALATICRASGYRCEMDYFNRSLKAQFKSAERIKAQIVAILGEDEINNSQITLKHLASGNQVTIAMNEMIDQIDEWLLEDQHHHHHHEHE